jgi:hypothetical protein
MLALVMTFLLPAAVQGEEDRPSNLVVRESVLATVAALASFGFASCGDSGASKEEIAAAEHTDAG